MDPRETFGTLLCLRRGRVGGAWERTALGQKHVALLDEEHAREGRVVRELAVWKPDRIVSSDLQRARHTAERLAEVLGAPLVLRRELRERRFGRWQGRAWTEILEAEEQAATAFLHDYTRAVPPGGESLEDVRLRVLPSVLGEFRRYKRRCVLYVGHAGPIRCLLAVALDVDLLTAQRLRLDPFGLSVIEWQGPTAQVRLLNHPAAGEHPRDVPSG